MIGVMSPHLIIAPVLLPVLTAALMLARGLLGHGPGPGGRAPAPATHDETPATAVTDLTAPGAPRTPPAGGHDVASEGGHDVASDTGADTTTLSRTQPNMPEQAQNTPKTLKTKQNPRHGFTMTRV